MNNADKTALDMTSAFLGATRVCLYAANNASATSARMDESFILHSDADKQVTRDFSKAVSPRQLMSRELSMSEEEPLSGGFPKSGGTDTDSTHSLSGSSSREAIPTKPVTPVIPIPRPTPAIPTPVPATTAPATDPDSANPADSADRADTT
jgi:hypothetical protein